MDEQKMNALTVRRNAVTSKLNRIQDVLGHAANISIYHLETYHRVDSCYDEYNSIQNEVYMEFPDQRIDQEKYFIDFEIAYEDLRVELCQAIGALRRNDDSTKLTVAEVVQQQLIVANQTPGLPTVPLPVFDGT